MTELHKTVTRKTPIDGHPMVVSITREGVWYRRYRSRTAYLLPHATACRIAGKLAGEALLAARKRARRGK